MTVDRSKTDRLVDNAEIGNMASYLVSNCGKRIVEETVFVTEGVGLLSAE